MWKKRKQVMAVFVASLFLMTCAASAITDNYTENEPPEDVEGVAPLVVLGLMGASALLGWMLSNDLNQDDHQNHAGDEGAVKDVRRTDEVNAVYNRLNDASVYISSGAGLDTELLPYASQYYKRTMEIAASAAWKANTTYNGDALLVNSNVRAVTNAVVYNWQSLWDTALWTHRDVRAHWAADTSDTFNSMKMSWSWNGGSSGYTGLIYPDFVTFATPTSGHDIVYLDTAPPENESYQQLTSMMVYVTGSGGRLTSLTGGASYTLAEGANNVSAIPSGLYRLDAGVTYAGPFMYSVADDAAELTGGAVLVSGTELIYVTSNGSDLKVLKNGTSYTSSTVGYKIEYNNGLTKEVDIGNSIHAFNAMITQVKKTLKDSDMAGRLAWYIFDTAGEASSIISPSSVLPVISNVDLTLEQAYSVSVLLAIEASAYYQRNLAAITSADLLISMESLDLVCHGTIYDAKGNVLISDAIFSPFNTVQDQAVLKGRSMWNQEGVAMVWAKAASLDAWNGKSTMAEMRTIMLTDGCYFDITAMKYKQEPVDAIILYIDQMQKHGLIEIDDHEEKDPTPDFANLDTLVKLAALIIGALLILIGYRGEEKNPYIMLFGLIVIVAGFIFTGTISDVLVTVEDKLPF